MYRQALIVGLALVLCAGVAQACGPDTDCVIGDRIYRIDLPEDRPETTGALIFAHGYRGSAKGTMRNKALRGLVHELGLALVAADTAGDDWVIPNVPRNEAADGSEEFAYFEALSEDLVARFGLDRTQFFVAGFSAGGMMVWELACKRGTQFRAFIAVAGTFWAPVPRSCSDLADNLIHIHGRTDRIVPLQGRPIADTHQGDVFQALDLAAHAGGYDVETQVRDDDLTCSLRTGPPGGLLAFCTHDGGHSIKMAYLRVALRLLEERGVFIHRR